MKGSMFRMKNHPKHSLLAVLSSTEVKHNQAIFCEYLQQGIKLILFTEMGAVELGSEFNAFQASRLLQYFKVGITSDLKGLIIKDGEMDDIQDHKLQTLGMLCPEFNEEQYRVEHVDGTFHLCVEAGAGTGKTTVMIQRIFYLVHTLQVPLSEIVMITFTREAAQNMFHKLRQAFFERYKITRSVRYLEYIEEMRMMRISTIHSFARTLIRELGTELGYGQNVKIRNLQLERKRIIERHVNDKTSEWLGKVSLVNKFKGIPLYKIVSIIDAYWTEMERKGLTGEEINDLKWGEAFGDSSDLHEIFKEVIPLCEKEYDQLKRESNAVTLSDLTRQVEYVSRRQDAFKSASRPISFMFIDEFQDTDDSQIKLAARLVQAMNARLFVVGDIKQSIYRFRGADYTAFDSLRKLLAEQKEKQLTLSLRKNYRSTEKLLQEMDMYFSSWGRKELLEYDKPLVGMNHSTDTNLYMESRFFKKYSDEHRNYTIELINRAKRMVCVPNEEKIAVLVRTNSQAWRLKKWLDKAKINAHLDIGGTFFISPAIKELSYLIDALLYPDSARAQLNLFNSSYSKTRIHWSMLTSMNGNESDITAWLKSSVPFDLWREVPELLLTKPLLSVLRDILESVNPAARYYEDQLKLLEIDRPEDPENRPEARTRAAQYQKNINHMIELLHQQFSTDFISLYRLSSWLKQNMAVNRDEDEPELSEDELGSRIRIMTVHKSKGLEFHTVIIPLTEQNFRYERSELLLSYKEGKWNAGWQIKEGTQLLQSNSYHGLSNTETLEVEKEEARLLYVAMTRSEKNLWVLRNIKYGSWDNWCRLLSI